MIISNSLKCIFIAVPKTATHAIRFAMRRYMDTNQDWEQVGLFIQKKLPFADLAKIDTGHIKALEAKPVLGDSLWEAYFKFAAVRNPYDRFVSFCAFIHREDLAFKDNALERMKQIIANPEIHQRILFRPQHEFVCDAGGKLLVDFIAHHERLQSDYGRICASIGIREDQLPRINRSIHSPYGNYYDEELRAAVYAFYRRDFELFGYPSTINKDV